jgi:hypothetical protein
MLGFRAGPLFPRRFRAQLWDVLTHTFYDRRA